MAITYVDVSTYLVYMYGGPDGNNGVDATIHLRLSDGSAYLRFYPEGATIPPNQKTTHSSGNVIYYLSYRYAQFASVVDVLRNEQPIRFMFNDASLSGYVTTSNEAVGEGEDD